MEFSRLYFMSLFLILFSCKNDKSNNSSDSFQGAMNQTGIIATADFQGAYGLLVMEQQNQGTQLHFMSQHNRTADELNLDVPRFSLDDGELKFGQNFFPQNFYLESTAQPKMQKIDKDTGEIKDALTQEAHESSQGGPPDQSLPDLMTIAVAPTKEVYLHFKEAFIYKDVPMGEDAWKEENGYRCQIFKVNGGTIDDLVKSTPSSNNLECLNNKHFIDTFGGREMKKVFQFDDAGNVYYLARSAGNQRSVVYKRLRDGSSTSEIINANICIQDFLITGSGAVFYTGQTCQNGQQGSGNSDGGFFRYVSPGDQGKIIEIARGWWNFLFDTKVEESASGTTDTAVFFGPDPRQTTTASWNSACLFFFDPSESEPSSRISDVITCGADIWSWMNLNRAGDTDEYGRGFHNQVGSAGKLPSSSWKKEYARRCESSDEVFAGGGSSITAIEQAKNGDVYVVGNVRKKKAGTLTCDVEFRGPHCVIDSIPALSIKNDSGNVVTLNTQALCSANAGTWLDKGSCTNGSTLSSVCLSHGRTWSGGSCSDGNYSNESSCIPEWHPETVWYRSISGDICSTDITGDMTVWHDYNDKSNRFSSSGSSEVSSLSDYKGKFVITNMDCQSSGSSGDWTDEVKALGKVNSTTKDLELLSLGTEQAINLWLINDEIPYYSSYDSTSGQYLLNKISDTPACLVTTYTTEQDCNDASYSWVDRSCRATAYGTKAACQGANLTWIVQTPMTLIENFEAYNLAPSGDSNKILVDGLDFSSNEYKFGTLSLDDKNLELKQGLTGTLKTIVILPQSS